MPKNVSGTVNNLVAFQFVNRFSYSPTRRRPSYGGFQLKHPHILLPAPLSRHVQARVQTFFKTRSPLHPPTSIQVKAQVDVVVDVLVVTCVSSVDKERRKSEAINKSSCFDNVSLFLFIKIGYNRCDARKRY